MSVDCTVIHCDILTFVGRHRRRATPPPDNVWKSDKLVCYPLVSLKWLVIRHALRYSVLYSSTRRLDVVRHCCCRSYYDDSTVLVARALFVEWTFYSRVPDVFRAVVWRRQALYSSGIIPSTLDAGVSVAVRFVSLVFVNVGTCRCRG